MSRVRVLLRPRWLLVHLVALALIVAMILLGRWQLTVSERKHFSLQNFGYALQWWVFSAFVLGMWVRVAHDALRSSGAPPQQAESAAPGPQNVQYRRYVMPKSSDAAPADDPERAAYNDYLARLASEGQPRTGSEGTGG